MSRKSRVFISVDIEGISGIVSPEQCGGQIGEYQVGRRLMVGDLNAAIDGAVDAGAEEIVIRDGHGGKTNIQPEDLHCPEATTLIRGDPSPLGQMSGISSEFDAAVFVGYHAKAGTQRAILCHTWSDKVDSIHVNGLEVGETGLSAALAGYYGVPVVFISGDSAVEEEAKAIIPNIITAVVKWGTSWQTAKCLPPRKAGELIRRKTAEALQRVGQVKPFRFNPPIEVKLKLRSVLMADHCEVLPYIERIDGKTLRGLYQDYVVAFKATRAANFLA